MPLKIKRASIGSGSLDVELFNKSSNGTDFCSWLSVSFVVLCTNLMYLTQHYQQQIQFLYEQYQQLPHLNWQSLERPHKT